MTDNVLNQVVAKGLCIGCGACATICPGAALHVTWNHEEGMPQAMRWDNTSDCDKECGLCLRVCPFSRETRSSEAIAEALFSRSAGIKYHHEGGYWLNAFVGFSPDEAIRERAASGGMVTYWLKHLMESRQITGAICVGSTHGTKTDEGPLFSYRICRDISAIMDCSGSAHYPVGMESALRELLDTPGRYAMVALPCMAKALRLLCERNRTIRERLVFVFGLVCGQVKTAHFSEFIAAKCGLSHLQNIKFRVKSPQYPTANFGVRVSGPSGSEKLINFNELSRFWSDRYFTPQACNYCADLFAETADAAFMDAWSPGLENDWRGWSYVIVRNPVLLGMFEEASGILPVAINQVDFQKVISSQAFALTSKREDIHWRLKQAKKELGYTFRVLPALRQPRISRRLITETTLSMSQLSNKQWIKYRFKVLPFLRSMSYLRLKIEGARQVWRIAKLAALVKEKLGLTPDE